MRLWIPKLKLASKAVSICFCKGGDEVDCKVNGVFVLFSEQIIDGCTDVRLVKVGVDTGTAKYSRMGSE
jgi:hypothetical protein